MARLWRPPATKGESSLKLIGLGQVTRRGASRMRPSAAQIGQTVQWAAGLVLAPLLQGAEEILIGGQAVIEGVMMRSPHSFAVAVRRPSGTIAVTQEYLERPSERHRWLKLPVLRGLATLAQAMVIGIRARRYAAEQAWEDTAAANVKEKKKGKLGGWMLAANLAFSLGFFILFYKLVPLYLATLFKRHYSV